MMQNIEPTSVIVAVGGLLGGYFTYSRAIKKDKSENDLVSESQSFSQMEKVLDAVMRDFDVFKAEQREERKQWATERMQFIKEIKELSGKIAEYEKTIAVLSATVELLKKHDTTAVKKIAKEM